MHGLRRWSEAAGDRLLVTAHAIINDSNRLQNARRAYR
jgi:hypothetical protein